MSGLPNEHRDVILKLLQRFPDEDVLSLATTVTRGTIVVSGVAEARNAIISFSDSVESILRRKKVKQEYLVQFLWEHKIEMPKGIEKAVLVGRFLEFLPVLASSCHPQSLQPLPATPPPPQPPAPAPAPAPGASAFGAAFAQQAVPWFVSLFNDGAALGPQHFWPDAQLRLALRQRGAEEGCVACAGAEEAAARLQAVHRGGLRLAPPQALPEPGSASADEFGRVTVSFRGCAHHASVDGPAGLFQLSMGLIQDVPGPDTAGVVYKIKFLSLEVESQLPPRQLSGEDV